MFDFEFRKDLSVGRVGLEMSLKPFGQLDDDFIRKVCTELFDQYRDLIRHATSVAVMLWAADGSDILEYTGDLDQRMEWCRYVGNPNMKPEDETPADPGKIGLHAPQPALYGGSSGDDLPGPGAHHRRPQADRRRP